MVFGQMEIERCNRPNDNLNPNQKHRHTFRPDDYFQDKNRSSVF